MKKYTVITIIVAALLSMFLLGMNPVGQQSELPEGIYTSDPLEGYTVHQVTFNTENDSTNYYVKDEVSFGSFLPSVPAKNNKNGAWLIDGTLDIYLAADTQIKTDLSVTAVYANEDYMAAIPTGMLGLEAGNPSMIRYLSATPKNNNTNWLDRISENYLSQNNLPPYWSFTYAGSFNDSLNYYYVNCGSGYLNISSGSLTVTSNPQKIVVKLWDNNTVTLGSSDNVYKVTYNHGSGLFKTGNISNPGTNEKFSFYYSFRDGYDQFNYSPKQITFNANGGSITPAPIKGKQGQTIKMPGYQGTRYGYKFLGWNADQNAEEPQYEAFAEYTITDNENTTFYAVWQKIDLVNISLGPNTPGTTVYTFSQYPGATVDLSVFTYINGDHEFQHWAYEDGTPVADLTKFVVPDHDTTLYAVWDVIVDIDANGGMGNTRVRRLPGEALDLSEFSVSNGLHELQGWAESADGDVKYQKNDVLSADVLAALKEVTLYAVWDTEIVYVAFYEYDGSLAGSEQYTLAEKPDTIIPPSVSGRGGDYEFLGWSKDKDAIEADSGCGPEDEIPAPDKDTDFYAVWKHTVTITFIAEGADIRFTTEDADISETSIRLVSGEMYELSEVIVTPADTEKVFDHWEDEEDADGFYLAETVYIVPDRYATLKAVWKSPLYTITFSPNGGTGDPIPDQIRLRVGESKKMPSWNGSKTETRNNKTQEYEFLGWSEGTSMTETREGTSS